MKATKKELMNFYWFLKEYKRLKTLPGMKQAPKLIDEFINSEAGNETPTVTDNEAKGEDFYRLKYEKCIKVIKRFDPGIIGMYDL